MKKKNGCSLILFALYLAVLLYFLFFAEGFREAASATYRYNFIPFHEIKRYLRYANRIGYSMVFLNLAGNVLAFLPMGYFVPKLSRRGISFWSMSLYVMEVSMTVEVLQLLTRVGCCDVDDVILNTLGGMLGYWCYYLRKECRRT